MVMRIPCKKCHSCECRNLLCTWKIPELRFAPSGMTAHYYPNLLNGYIFLIFPLPFFHSFFQSYGCYYIICLLKPHELMAIVFFCKSLDQILYMFIHTSNKVVCNSDVKYIVMLVCHHVHIIGLHNSSIRKCFSLQVLLHSQE